MQRPLLGGRQPRAAVGADQDVVVALGSSRTVAGGVGLDAVHPGPGVERDPDHECQPGHDQTRRAHQEQAPAATPAVV